MTFSPDQSVNQALHACWETPCPPDVPRREQTRDDDLVGLACFARTFSDPLLSDARREQGRRWAIESTYAAAIVKGVLSSIAILFAALPEDDPVRGLCIDEETGLPYLGDGRPVSGTANDLTDLQPEVTRGRESIISHREIGSTGTLLYESVLTLVAAAGPLSERRDCFKALTGLGAVTAIPAVEASLRWILTRYRQYDVRYERQAVGLLIESQLGFCTGLYGSEVEDGALPSQWLESYGIDCSYAALRAERWAEFEGGAA